MTEQELSGDLCAAPSARAPPQDGTDIASGRTAAPGGLTLPVRTQETSRPGSRGWGCRTGSQHGPSDLSAVLCSSPEAWARAGSALTVPGGAPLIPQMLPADLPAFLPAAGSLRGGRPPSSVLTKPLTRTKRILCLECPAHITPNDGTPGHVPLLRPEKAPESPPVAQRGYQLVNTFQKLPQGPSSKEQSAWSMPSCWEHFPGTPQASGLCQPLALGSATQVGRTAQAFHSYVLPGARRPAEQAA